MGFCRLSAVFAVIGMAMAASGFAQTGPAAAPPAPARAPAAPAATSDRQPPAGSAPVVRAIELRFPKQNDASVIEPQTYLYYIQTRPSRPSENVWVPYDEHVALEDFKRLWNTNFLDDLSIEVNDVPYPNGVIGKHIVFNMEERQRIKIVEYVGSKVLEQTKIDEKVKEKGLSIRLDSFIDPSLINRVKGVVREMLSEKGYLDGNVTHETLPVPGGPKLVHLTFHIEEGPKYKIRDVEFLGNQALSDGKLSKRLKSNRPQGMWSWITGRGTYQQEKFEEDADKVVEYYRDRGYITATVGQPEVRTLETAKDGKTRYVQLRIPVKEGLRYRIGTFEFDGNTVVKSEPLRTLYNLKQGDYYSEKTVRKGIEKTQEVYGRGGYFEFTAYPDLKPRDTPAEASDTNPGQKPASAQAAASGPPIVDVTMKLQEGKQYFVNRITFTGNTTTRDNVIRREIRLYEGGVFDTESLKNSVRRLNQLGYFKNLEQNAIKVDKTANQEGRVDLTLRLEEQNRNQLTFGAGVSQYEGFFGQLSFQTANFMGRGETFSVALQAGSRSQNFQVGFTEPYMFDRPFTGGISVFKRQIRYPQQFTQDSRGLNVQFGFPVADFTRGFVAYSYEQVKVEDLNPLYNDPAMLARNPFLADSLLLNQGGRRTISKIVPSIVKNTVDNPIFPNTGRRYTASVDLAGLGGNTNYIKPRVEGVWFLRHTGRTSVGLRGQFEYVNPFGSTDPSGGTQNLLPIFERLFLGGEYSVRGFDIRSIGPRDPISGIVLGGNKTLLFNAEYLISIAGPVRLVLFYDAGQVRNFGEPFSWKEDLTKVIYPSLPLLIDPFATTLLTDPSAPGPQVVTTGETNAFKTSTGAEIRFFMPVLNVPFRLIFAKNPSRAGVLNNNLEPVKDFVFRFAVGTTF